MATELSPVVADPAAMIITILCDDSRAHAYRTVGELLSTRNEVPTWSSAQCIRFFDNRGHRLEPRFGPDWHLIDLVRVGEPDPEAVLQRLHTVLDRAVERVYQNPESVEDWGVTCADAVEELNTLRRLPLEDLVDDESILLDTFFGESTPRGGQDGPVPHGGWWHRIAYH